MKSSIILKNVDVKYKNPQGGVFYALKDICLEIQSGEYLAILGTSGSGKTSLSNIIGLLSNHFTGEYYFNQSAVHTFSEAQRGIARSKKFGFVFQDYVLMDHLTALENVEMALRYSHYSQSEIRKKAREKLSLVGLDDKIQHKPFQLSGGQKQRVSIARALINDPEVIIADEPTGALDKESRCEILSLLQDLNESGVTIITVTHSVEDAQAAKRVIYIEKGKIISDNYQTDRRRFFGTTIDAGDKKKMDAREIAIMEHLHVKFGVVDAQTFIRLFDAYPAKEQRWAILKQLRPIWFLDDAIVSFLSERFFLLDDISKTIISKEFFKAQVSPHDISVRVELLIEQFWQRDMSEDAALTFFLKKEDFEELRPRFFSYLFKFFSHPSPRVRASSIALFRMRNLLTPNDERQYMAKMLSDTDSRVRSNMLDYFLNQDLIHTDLLKDLDFSRDASPRIRAAWSEILIRMGLQAQAMKILEPMWLSSDKTEILSAIWVLGKNPSFNIVHFVQEIVPRNPMVLAHFNDILNSYQRARENKDRRPTEVKFKAAS